MKIKLSLVIFILLLFGCVFMLVDYLDYDEVAYGRLVSVRDFRDWHLVTIIDREVGLSITVSCNDVEQNAEIKDFVRVYKSVDGDCMIERTD